MPRKRPPRYKGQSVDFVVGYIKRQIDIEQKKGKDSSTKLVMRLIGWLAYIDRILPFAPEPAPTIYPVVPDPVIPEDKTPDDAKGVKAADELLAEFKATFGEGPDELSQS